MKRRWKVLIALGVALAILLAVNTVVVDSQTKPANVTITDGRILHLAGGDVQVLEQGPPVGLAASGRARRMPAGEDAPAPIVLIHCYSCSLHWWDQIAPMLARDHPVIRIDLLGFGGSEKPNSGYSIDEPGTARGRRARQARRAGRRRRRPLDGLRRGDLAGPAVEPARRSARGHRRGADDSLGAFPFIARLGYVPVIGQAIWRVTPSFAIKDALRQGLRPGLRPGRRLRRPDQVVHDFRAMTFSSYDDAYCGAERLRRAAAARRARARTRACR